MIDTWLLTARSRRGGMAPPAPLRHALTWSAWQERGRATARAVCGAQVAVLIADEFDGDHARACPKCVTKLSELDTAEELLLLSRDVRAVARSRLAGGGLEPLE